MDRRFITVIVFSLLISLKGIAQKSELENVALFTGQVFELSEVMLHDVVNPPAASRFYAYSLLAAYEITHLSGGRIPDINQKLNARPDLNGISIPHHVDLTFCSIYTMLDVGRQLMPSGYTLKENQKDFVQQFRRKKILSEHDIKKQIVYCEAVAAAVVAYTKTDGYNKLSTYIRHKPSKAEGHWYPTPPEYMAAVEPHWKTIRPFLIDSASQFSPIPPAAFSKDSTSTFYKYMKETYDVVNNLTDEQKQIANFWDCNPFAVIYSGHLATGLKKISPGGHWMGITGIVCNQAKISLDSTIFVHTVVALTIHDAFISCWSEKYASDRIRPEAAINKLIDPSWRPLLQTPPFPEYTSGHSVVSASVATILTYLLGDNFAFTDTSELYFGLPERKFTSFNHAAKEAAISRLYGGIHFRDACEQGLVQGRQIGEFILNSLLNLQP